MPIYSKPTRLLMKDFVAETGIAKGQIVTRDQVVSWFKANYPKIKEGTISAHLIKMSTNAPSRFYYKANPNGEDDLFFQIDGGRFRLYEAGNDPAPIYGKAQAGIAENPHSAEVEETTPTNEFAYERDLRNFLAKNLTLIEPGLRLYEEEGITGVEFPVGGRLIDILAIDKSDTYVVIELKVSRGYDPGHRPIVTVHGLD
jgi:endonuclease